MLVMFATSIRGLEKRGMIEIPKLLALFELWNRYQTPLLPLHQVEYLGHLQEQA